MKNAETKMACGGLGQFLHSAFFLQPLISSLGPDSHRGLAHGHQTSLRNSSGGCLEPVWKLRGALFSGKRPNGGRDEGEYPWGIFDLGTTRPDALFRENHPAAWPFVR